MLGLLMALAGVLLAGVTGLAMYDGAASVVIGLILGGTAAWLAYETHGLLIGEAANQRVVDGIRSLAASFEPVDHVNEVLIMHMGPEFILLNLSVKFTDSTDAPELERTIAAMDRRIKAAYPEVRRIFVEAEARADA